jgi:hypothetical protein
VLDGKAVELATPAGQPLALVVNYYHVSLEPVLFDAYRHIQYGAAYCCTLVLHALKVLGKRFSKAASHYVERARAHGRDGK